MCSLSVYRIYGINYSNLKIAMIAFVKLKISVQINSVDCFSSGLMVNTGSMRPEGRVCKTMHIDVKQ